MNATDLPSWAWRDPCEVAERREAMRCDGCMFRVVLFDIAQCVKHRNRVGETMYRCVDFRGSKR